ncbi:excisionase family DNA-binding protein [Nocardiopsis exhalans]|uniref:Excisionase family DNA-binding protein n=1 Tax=Nocardiopsis exhalans TaxID=163604 RepID=A0ABY5DFT5_9ACTN|nr:excisionase family DNA-binding protein [Nocardiopsis exhalans]USY23222.1 excisionase family DNA-binding protein [Nocardiopsis exhalans]
MLRSVTVDGRFTVPAEPWLSADDIAARLGVTKDTVYTWIAENVMPTHKFGRLWRFQVSEADGWTRCGGTGAGRDSAGE